ncbi:MAG: copper resistance protein NlpE [Bacteroides sp.]|nr:copper resistance protein NlpE [Bacteroidales bacterium]MBD5206140.1 copper resistance protein NlpE [Bacteroidales bacterium]MBD5305574.1 copper resistance protein NlpE [Bacteroides sp.]MBD5348755.1 copper resistance protein NlpE [Bacteroides sp.]
MKKTIYLASAALALISLASCSGNKSCNGEKCNKVDDMLYTGVLPAADCDGIRYTLKLDYDDDKNNLEGDYNLVETYLQADTVNKVNGINGDISFKSEGDFTVVEQNGKKYLKLVKDAKDSNPQATPDFYFEVSSDSTLTMVNSQLEAAPDTLLNYTLKLVK